MTEHTPDMVVLKQAIERSIIRLQRLPDYAARPAWDKVVSEELQNLVEEIRHASLIEGIRLGLEMAAETADDYYRDDLESHAADAILNLDPEEIIRRKS